MRQDEEYGEDHSFLGCDVTQFGRNIAIFWWNLLPPSLVQKWKQQVPVHICYLCTKPYSNINQKTITFLVISKRP
jgi:hypothetical protein